MMADPSDLGAHFDAEKLGILPKTKVSPRQGYTSKTPIRLENMHQQGPDRDEMTWLSTANITFSEFDEFGLTKRFSRWKTEWTEVVDRYKMSIEKKYIHHKDQPLAKLYTEPIIIQNMRNGGFKNVHVDELFEPKAPLRYPIVLQGNSGSGKSYIAQKVLLDWASGERYHNFDLVFYLRCEELVRISEEMNLFELLSWSCNLTSDQISEMIMYSSSNVLFLIDGFDELRFLRHDYYTLHPFAKARPEVIVCALLGGHILPRPTLLITTRNIVPRGTLFKSSKLFFESVGFSEIKIEEYFQKFFQDEDLFRKAFNSVKANETLFTACSSPVICWIICTVIRERFSDGSDVTSGLETTTSIYVDFVFTLLEHHCQGLSESVPTLLKSLGQLAERGVLEQQVLFDERTINETVQDPVHNPFLNKFLLEKRIQLETMFRFMHLSFQEFFTALYYVLLDEDESQKKVRELLHAVERGWALSCWSVANSEVRSSKQLQSVILFLWGFCKNKSINSFFEKHNVTVPVNIETQLKEWIHQCSLRYQNENMMFILHCLYELHDKSFTGNVLEGLILIDLSNISLNRTDCYVLRFCLQCCQHIRNLRLNVSSDNLKILLPALCSCEELWLRLDNLPKDAGDLILALGKGKIQNQLIMKVDKKRSPSYSEIIASAKDGDLTLSVSCSKSKRKSPLLLSQLALTCSHTETQILQKLQLLPSFGGSEKKGMVERSTLLEVLQSVSGLKKVHLHVESWTEKWVSTILSLTQTCSSLNELRIRALIPLALTQIQRASLKQKSWTLTVWRMSMFIERDKKSLTEEGLKTGTGEMKVFTPDFTDDESKGENTHRFVSPHAGQFQCSLTNLVFVMEGKGEMLYKMVPWDPRRLDGLGQMEPAGPLYDIDRSKGSVSQLHLPHCEIITEENKDSLAVAHFTNGTVEILQPLKVTDTHVIISITELCWFGIIKKVKKKIFPGPPTCVQVLLFLRPITVAQNQKILNVYLLPGNVPLLEVQRQHKEKTYIETSSICQLISGRKYRLCCHPEECEVQPPDGLFKRNFGTNFHTTFEVFLDVSIEEIKLGLLDTTEEGKEVWKPRRIPLSAPAQGVECSVDRRFTESQYVDKHRPQLIQKVTSVMEIADCFRSKGMIAGEMYNKVNTAKTRQEKMRIFFDVLESGGNGVKAEFWKLLKEKEPHLVDELESGS